MSSAIVDVAELPHRLQELLTLVGNGAEIILTEHGVPRARLLPPPPPKTAARVPDLHPGAMQAADDFVAELPQDFWLGAS